MITIRESAIERHLVERIHKIGGECLKLRSPGRVGVPDRLVILPGGEVFWVETKATDGALSPQQKRFHNRLNELTQDVKVLWSIQQVDRHFPIEKD